MKKVIISAVFFVVAVTSFCQQVTPSPGLPLDDYLKKSKNQKTAAWVLLGGGSVLIITGFLIGDRKESSFGDAGTGAIIGIAGFLSTLGSIPLFIASSRNKRKASHATVSLQFEKTPAIQQTGLSYRSYYPAVSLKFNL
jgi:hypothetical protein